MSSTSACYVATRRVEFCETDLAGIVHFANFYRYMEQAEHEYFRSRDLRIVDKQPDGIRISWPRVQSSCSFKAPAFYEDLLKIHVRIVRLGDRSLTISYEFRRDNTLLALGEMKTVCVELGAEHGMKSIDIPPRYRQQFESDRDGPPTSLESDGADDRDD